MVALREGVAEAAMARAAVAEVHACFLMLNLWCLLTDYVVKTRQVSCLDDILHKMHQLAPAPLNH